MVLLLIIILTHLSNRRYPDLIVHRLLDKYLSGEKSVEKDLLEKTCKHCSEMEKTASRAERDSIKYAGEI